MALLIEIIKVEETDVYVQYKFLLSDKDFGLLNINRKTGDINIIKEAPYDTKGIISERAARAIVKHWVKGEYPDKTCWAS